MWIARDKDGSTWIYYSEKPHKNLEDGCWEVSNRGFNELEMHNIFDSYTPKIRWEDYEPLELENNIY